MPEACEIEVLRCRGCGALDPGPREVCGVCLKRAFEPHAVPGEGVLVSWTMVRHPPARFREEGAYAVAAVVLEAGVQVTGRLAGADETVKPGRALRCRECRDGVPVFEVSS